MKFSIETKLETRNVIAALQDRLMKRYVRIKTDNNSITSTYTPFSFHGLMPTVFSKDNWIGINPFQFISKIKIECKAEENKNTKVDINVYTAKRLWFWIVFWLMLPVALFAINLTAGFVGILFAAIINLIIYHVFAVYLVKFEINDAIENALNDENINEIIS